jgi:hypothetical protein
VKKRAYVFHPNSNKLTYLHQPFIKTNLMELAKIGEVATQMMNPMSKCNKLCKGSKVMCVTFIAIIFFPKSTNV